MSSSIKNLGCQTDYTGDDLSLNENGEVFATMNSEQGKKIEFCVETKN